MNGTTYSYICNYSFKTVLLYLMFYLAPDADYSKNNKNHNSLYSYSCNCSLKTVHV